MKKKSVIALFAFAFLIALSIGLFFHASFKNKQDVFYIPSDYRDLWEFSPGNPNLKRIYSTPDLSAVVPADESFYVIARSKGLIVLNEVSKDGIVLREVTDERKTPDFTDMLSGTFRYHDGYLYGLRFSEKDLVRISTQTGESEVLIKSLLTIGEVLYSFSGDWLYAVGIYNESIDYWQTYLISYNLRTGEQQELLFDAIEPDLEHPFLDGNHLYFPILKDQDTGGQEYLLHHYVMNGNEISFQEEIRLYEDTNYDKLTLNGLTSSPIFAIHDGIILFGGADGYLYERNRSGKVTRLWYVRDIDTYFPSYFSYGKSGYLFYTKELFKKGYLFYRDQKRNKWTQVELNKS